MTEALIDPAVPASGQLRDRVEALLQLHKDTRPLTRAVAALLFLEHGEMPTANRIRQLIGVGSMSTISNELVFFWEQVRVQAKLRLEHAQVPPAVLAAFAEAIAGAWQLALSAAREGAAADLAQEREALLAAHAQAEEALAAERAAHAQRGSDLAAAQESLREASARATGLEETLAQLRSAATAAAVDARTALEASGVRIAELEAELGTLEDKRSALEARLASQHNDFVTREAAQDEHRRQLLLQVDGARNAQKEATTTARTAQQDLQRERATVSELQRDLATATQKEIAASARADSLRDRLDATQQELREARTQARADIEALQRLVPPPQSAEPVRGPKGAAKAGTAARRRTRKQD